MKVILEDLYTQDNSICLNISNLTMSWDKYQREFIGLFRGGQNIIEQVKTYFMYLMELINFNQENYCMRLKPRTDLSYSEFVRIVTIWGTISKKYCSVHTSCPLTYVSQVRTLTVTNIESVKSNVREKENTIEEKWTVRAYEGKRKALHQKNVV